MNRTEQILEQARQAQRNLANSLQQNLTDRLRELDEPQRTRIIASLQRLKDQHIQLLDEGVQSGLLNQEDYRLLMAGYTDDIDLSDLLATLS